MAQAVICAQAPGSLVNVLRTCDAPRNFKVGKSCLSVKVFDSQGIVHSLGILKAVSPGSGQNFEFSPRRTPIKNEFGKDGSRSRRAILRICAVDACGGGVGLRALSRRRGLGGRSLNGPKLAGHCQVSVRKRALKMATMAVPRALMEDSSSEYAVPADVESQQSDYGTFGASGGLKDVEDSFRDTVKPSSAFVKWDATTARLADSATAAFLLLQLPQIILNTQNLLAGNYAALSAVPWMWPRRTFTGNQRVAACAAVLFCVSISAAIINGQLTGLLGNLSLLSYFASKRERGAMVVQAVGVVSTLVVLLQLAVAGAMPPVAFAVTGTAVVIGLVLNFLNYINKLSPAIWRLWGEAVSIGGLTVLPQVMWSTFEPYIPHSTIPGVLFGILAVTMVVLDRLEKLPPKVRHLMGGVSAWTATLLFMWAPVAQWWTNYINPANIRGLSVFTVLLAMVGNSLLLPRALFTRDLMWFTGSGWGTMLQGWGILLSMYMCQVINDVTFWGVSAILALWLGSMLWNDSRAYQLQSPLKPLVELISGSRK